MINTNVSIVDNVSICSWNINGLGQKHRDESFIENVKYDINIILETWKGDSPDIKIKDYYSFSKYRMRKKRARRNSGGIIVYIKNEIKRGVCLMENITQSKNRIWLKLDKKFFGFKRDIFLCGVYIPPLNSPHYDNEYELLENEVNFLTDKGKILLMGEMFFSRGFYCR